MRYYLRLLLFATLLLVPLILLCISLLDKPVALLMHNKQPVRGVFEGVMKGTDYLWFASHVSGPLGLPWVWLLLPLLFLGSWLLRWQHATIWLVMLLTWVGSEALGNILKMYFNRPRPEVLWLHTAPDAAFWQPLGQYDAFPSGHTATVAGMLLPLALRFPKLRPWLLGVIGMVGVGRVVLELHWLSDVVAAVYLAVVLTCLVEIGTWWLQPSLRRELVSAAPDAT
ncbi:phosphatase PAP2 family protein [Hymenobacter wooponensis]|uniref:Phosphatase PAP2 family protein n=1 Tax=Hymenobacter wooponensis TaxID=1525360 RepID=A0A4Z0MU09_9BACT|nr:phosphatase PAP2 family protein [Hymenobacter wooponensis]TGD82806.1 phosphatase PAP2 family protein [Hymenobacter wooponensis]